ncbi:MAG: hypothetical protein Q9202_003841 [Teloschistes flavicans]
MFLPLSTANSDQDSEELKQWRPKTEAVVIRVAGGRITPALPGIIGIDTLLNFRETMIIHHTDPNVREVLKERAPAEASKIDGMVFGAFDDIEQSVRDDLDIFKGSQFVREEMKKSVYGFVYDIQTGMLTSVA